jgi:uncharacterized membrane protein
MSASDRNPPDADADADEAKAEETPLEEAVAGVVTGLVLLVAFGLLALDFSLWWVAFPVGFGGLLPAAVAIAKYYQSRDDDGRDDRGRDGDRTDALDTLRDQYARGLIDEDEFERRVETLLETEDADAARAYARRARRAGTGRTGPGADPDRATDAGPDPDTAADAGVDAEFDVEREVEAESDRERS